MPVEIVFTKGKTLGAKLLALALGNRFTHVAISDGTSTVEAEWGKGVFRQAKGKLLHMSKDVVTFHIAGVDGVWDFAQEQVGAGYDYTGAFGAWVRIPGLHWKYRWYCSELVNQAWRRFSGGPLLHTHVGLVRPDDLYHRLLELGYVPRGESLG